MTRAERQLWELLRGRRLDGHRFRRQQVIDGFIVDFYCHQARLVVEVDGDAHEATQEYDCERDRIISLPGIWVLRLTNDEVLTRCLATLNRIRHVIDVRTSATAFKQRSSPQSSPLPAGEGPGVR